MGALTSQFTFTVARLQLMKHAIGRERWTTERLLPIVVITVTGSIVGVVVVALIWNAAGFRLQFQKRLYVEGALLHRTIRVGVAESGWENRANGISVRRSTRQTFSARLKRCPIAFVCHREYW